jgi:predicted DCC family thiol-disulfide oxidoreductase YuxK
LLARPGLPQDFYFDSIQSGRFPAGEKVSDNLAGDPVSVILEVRASDGTVRVFERSTAILRTLISLGGGWRLMAVFYLVPRFARDAIYAWIARHRYAWFGRRDSCRLPTAAEKSRFLS